MGASWSKLMFAAIAGTGNFYVWIFFILFVLICHVLILSLLAALVLEIFSVEMEKAAKDNELDHLKQLFPSSNVSFEGSSFQKGAKFQVLPPLARLLFSFTHIPTHFARCTAIGGALVQCEEDV